jgi:hypothetical protein
LFEKIALLNGSDTQALTMEFAYVMNFRNIDRCFRFFSCRFLSTCNLRQHIFTLGLLLGIPQFSVADGALLDGWEVTGFGTIGYAESDKYNDLVLKRNITQRSKMIENHGWLVDSKLGLQARKELNPGWDVVGQIVAQEKVNNSLENSIEMAFLRYRSNDMWSFQLGRMVLDTFLLSDHRNVGYSYNSVRPQAEFYGWIPYSNYDGLKTVFEFGDFDSALRVEAFIGKTKSTINIGYEGDDSSYNYVKSSPILGGGVTWEKDELTLRAYIARFRFTQNTNAIKALQDIVSVPAIQQFWPEAIEIADAYAIENEFVTYSSLGFSWRPGPWHVQGELSNITSTFYGSYDGQRAYLQIGRRFGDFLPHITYAYSWDDRDFPYDPPPVPEFQELYAGLKDNLNSGTVDQRSLSIGIRWDFASQKALKFQCDFATIDDNSLGIYPTQKATSDGVRNWEKDSRSWCSTTFDWVF